MLELLNLYSSMGSPARGSLLFLAGLVVGSFAAALNYRIRHPHANLGHRSHCPQCRHQLGAIDLIPVVSFLILGGRCRHCSRRIAWTYPILEALCGLSTAVAGMVGGWVYGGVVLLAWTVGAATAGAIGRLQLAEERGFTLIEVLVACMLLAFVSGSILQVINVSRKNALAAHQRTLAVGLAREALATAAEEIRKTSGPAASGTITHPIYTQYTITTSSHDPKPTLVGHCYTVVVTVDCPECRVQSGSHVESTEVVCK